MPALNLPILPAQHEGDTQRGRSLRFMSLIFGSNFPSRVADGRVFRLHRSDDDADIEAGGFCARTGMWVPGSRMRDGMADRFYEESPEAD